jgi:hypothetical protein
LVLKKCQELGEKKNKTQDVGVRPVRKKRRLFEHLWASENLKQCPLSAVKKRKNARF